MAGLPRNAGSVPAPGVRRGRGTVEGVGDGFRSAFVAIAVVVSLAGCGDTDHTPSTSAPSSTVSGRSDVCTAP